MNINKISKKAAQASLIILAKVASFFKVSYIVGSHMAFFSATSVMMPLCGAFGGLRLSVAIVTFGLLSKFAMGSGLLSFKYLAYHIPGLFAALYFASPSLMIRIILPLVCMGLFVIHPVGGQAWAYTLFWLIPVGVNLITIRSFFAQALASTLVAHAVGSVIWLYAQPMTPAIWLGLIPVVIAERLCNAAGATVLHSLFIVVTQKYSMWQGKSHDQTFGLHNGWQSPVGAP